jgi:hypothetical protein
MSLLKGGTAMESRYGLKTIYSAFLALALVTWVGCSAGVARRPTLAEARSGQQPQEDTTAVGSGEIRAEVAEVDALHREIRVIDIDGGRRDIIPYDVNYTRVVYHGFDYATDALEAGDIITFVPSPRAGPYVDVIRLQVPVQARTPGSPYARSTGAPYARAATPVTRAQMLEGTVERIDYDRGVFDVRPRAGGRIVTVALPYNARGSDVENFRRLRNGDYVRVEGEYVNADNVQLMAFLR